MAWGLFYSASSADGNCRAFHCAEAFDSQTEVSGLILSTVAGRLEGATLDAYDSGFLKKSRILNSFSFSLA